MTIDQLTQHVTELFDVMAVKLVDIQAVYDKQLESYIIATTISSDENIVKYPYDVLRSLNHLVRKQLEKLPDDTQDLHFVIDINDNQGRRIRALKAQANLAAEKAIDTHMSIVMDPMPPHERRIIHAVLADTKNIETQSTGYGKNRCVEVKFVG